MTDPDRLSEPGELPLEHLTGDDIRELSFVVDGSVAAFIPAEPGIPPLLRLGFTAIPVSEAGQAELPEDPRESPHAQHVSLLLDPDDGKRLIASLLRQLRVLEEAAA